MDKLNKFSLPATIIIASLVLGGFYYASQVNKQRSIEKQQQIRIEAEKQDQLAKEIKEATEVNPTIQQEEAVEKEETQPEPKPEPTSDEGKTDKATLGEKNALSNALGYLGYTSFSYSGLVKQLEFEGYTHKEAVYGADNCGADWNEQATLKAKNYLDYSAFSRDGLLKQLEFDGFTRQQAEYGVQAVGY